MMRALGLAIILLASAPVSALELYLESGFGLDHSDDLLSDTYNRAYGRAAAGVEWSGIYIEAEHTSDVQAPDVGLNVVWVGIRREWELGR